MDNGSWYAAHQGAWDRFARRFEASVISPDERQRRWGKAAVIAKLPDTTWPPADPSMDDLHVLNQMLQELPPMVFTYRVDTDGEEVWFVERRRSLSALVASTAGVISLCIMLLLGAISAANACLSIPFLVVGLGLLLVLANRYTPVCWLGIRRTSGGLQLRYQWARVATPPQVNGSWGDCHSASDLSLDLVGQQLLLQTSSGPLNIRIPKEALGSVTAFWDRCRQDATEPTSAEQQQAARLRELLTRP